MLPDTLKEIGLDPFGECLKIKVIWCNSFMADILRRRDSYGSVAIISVDFTMTGNKFLRDTRRQKSVVIPDGVQEIGDQWFKGTAIESVTIPGSVLAFGE